LTFEEDLKRLEPFLGHEKMLRLWRAYQYEDMDGRRDMEAAVQIYLEQKLGISTSMLYPVCHPVGMADLMEMMALDRPDLKDSPFLPSLPPDLADDRDIFAAIRRHDILLYQPYDSFSPVVNFIRQAAHDPDVLAIKITLYRVGSNSPIVNALMEARENGLATDGIEVRGGDFEPPSNVGQAGQGGIAVGAITPDRNRVDAAWLWFVADNVRLAAENAVAVARELL